MLQSFVCQHCGKSFAARHDRPRRYCSRTCMGAARPKETYTGRKRVPRTASVCPTCGVLFEYLPSWPRKYCSNACKGKALISNTGRPFGTRYTTACESCGETFVTMPSHAARFCSQKCFGRWVSAQWAAIPKVAPPPKPVKISRPPSNLGKKYAYKRRKTWVIKVCPTCAESFEVEPSESAIRSYCSLECAIEAHSGEGNANWSGGHISYYGPSWHAAKRAVRARDCTCRRCGMTPEENGRALDVHHVSPFRVFGVARHEEANHLDNLIAFCHDCHVFVEWETNRSARRTAR